MRSMRATLFALLLAVLCLGETLLPGHALLPQPFDSVATPSLTIEEPEQEGAPARLPGVEAPTREAYVPHRKDKLLQFYPFDTWVGDAWRHGELPLWTPRMLCGLPLLAQGTSRAFYPSAAAFAVLEPSSAYAWLWLLHLTLAGLFAYRLARRLGASEGGGLLACGTIVLSGYASGHVHHPMIFNAAIWALPALEAVHAMMRPRVEHPRKWQPLLFLSLAVAMSWFAGFAQASVLLSYLVVSFAILLGVLAWKETGRFALRSLLWPAAGLSLGTLLALVQILPMAEMAAHASRSPAELSVLQHHALPWAALLEFLLPGQLCIPGEVLVGTEQISARPSFLSLALLPTEHAKQLAAGLNNINHTEIALGIGFWPLVFALLGLRRLFSTSTPRQVRFVLGFFYTVTVLGLLAALAVPGVLHALHLLPGFAVGDLKRLLMLPALALPILAGLGWRMPRRQLLPAAGILGIGIAILGIVVLAISDESFARGFGSWIAPRFGASAEDFVAALAPGEPQRNHFWLGKGILFAGLAIGLGPLLAREMRLGAIGFVAATLLVQLPIAWDTSPSVRQESWGMFARDRWIGSEPETGRILNIEVPRPGEAMRSPGDQRLGTSYLGPYATPTGYAPLAPKRLEDFFALWAPDSVSHGAGLGPLRFAPRPGENPRALSALRAMGVSHLLSNTPIAPATGFRLASDSRDAAWLQSQLDEQGMAPRNQAIPYIRETAPVGAQAAKCTASILHWYPSVEFCKDDAELRERSAAFLDAGLSGSLPVLGPHRDHGASAKATSAEIQVIGEESLSQRSLPLQLRMQAAEQGWLFAAISWMPGFEYRVDEGEWQPTLPALTAFQAIPVPSGKSSIELRYRPKSILYGAIGTLLAAIILALLPLLGLADSLTRPFWRRHAR
jgi:hypothetical protein